MTLTSALLASILATAGSDGPDPTLGAALTTERLAIPDRFGSVELVVDAMAARIVLLPERAPADLQKHLAGALSKLCPAVSREGEQVVLVCRLRAFQAQLHPGSHRTLEIRQIAGLPWTGALDAPPNVFYPPEQLGLGSACPGDSASARAECLLQAGGPEHAAELLRSITSPTSDYPRLRLGDIALRGGSVREAAASWSHAVLSDPFGRMARARLCELDGSCLRSAHESSVFDSGGLPEPLRSELNLRLARALVFTGRLAEAAVLLRSRRRSPDTCQAAPRLCQRMVLELLRTPEVQEIGLQLYLELPDHNDPPLASTLARAAARAATSAGAPHFAADLLASTVPTAGPAELEGHLAQAAELFLATGDRVRARVMIEYAHARLGEKLPDRRRWATIRRKAAARPSEPSARPFPALAPGLEAELASADAALQRARGLPPTEGHP